MVNNLIKNKNMGKEIAALITVLLFVIILSLRFDFYFDLNDDSAIRDLLSGNYSGKPEAHCMQLLYPLGFSLTCLYKIMPYIPWFGLVLYACQMFGLYGMVTILRNHLVSKDGRYKENLWVPAVLTVFLAGMMLREYIFVQYTVTAATLCVYVILDIMLDGTKHLKADAIVWLMAFCIRSEMGLLLLPFLGFGILCRNKLSFKALLKKKWIEFFTILILLLGFTWIVDGMAYSGEWRSFREFFDARTTIYDYTGIPDYESNEFFFQENNISKENYQHLVSYNFGLDDDIDVKMLQTIADYAEKNRPKSNGRRLYEACYTYVYDVIHGYEWGYYVLIVISYIFLFKIGLDRKQWVFVLYAGGLLALRSAIWVYLYYAGRIGGLPARITHPLFLCEIMMCVGLLIGNYEEAKWKLSNTFCIITTYVVIALLLFIIQVDACRVEYEAREIINSEWNNWVESAKENPERFYYLDVYKCVKYSEKLFAANQSEFRNFDYAGGWISKSPASKKKYQQYGFDSPSQGILSNKAEFVDNIGN